MTAAVFILLELYFIITPCDQTATAPALRRRSSMKCGRCGKPYSTNSIRPQLVQLTVCRPLFTLWRSCVGSDIRQPWQRSRSTLATARPPLDFRNVS